MKSQRTESSRIGHSRFIVATATVLIALATGPVIYVAQANTVPTVEAPTAAAVASTLVRCGLSAESLAAAGVDAAGATSVRAAMATKLENDGPTLSAATESLASARTALESLRKSITGEPSQAESAQIAQASENVAAAESTLASAVASFVEAAQSPLSAEKRATLAIVRSNASRALPAPYLVQTLSDEDAVALRDALAAERIALKQEAEVPAEAASHLATVRAIPAVAAALANTESNLAAIKSALAGS